MDQNGEKGMEIVRHGYNWKKGDNLKLVPDDFFLVPYTLSVQKKWLPNTIIISRLSLFNC